MAGTFDKFMSSVNRGITTINVKTSSSLERAKIKTHIDTLNSDIAKLFSLTGEMAYYKWKNGKEDLSDIYEKFEVIKQKFEEIEKLNAEIVQIAERDNDILVGGNTQQASAPQVQQATPAAPIVPQPSAAPQPVPVQTPAAPPVAPAPQPATQPVQVPPPVPVEPEVPVAPPVPPTPPAPVAPVGIVCPNCGAEFKTPVKFCRQCGTKLQ